MACELAMEWLQYTMVNITDEGAMQQADNLAIFVCVVAAMNTCRCIAYLAISQCRPIIVTQSLLCEQHSTETFIINHAG